MDKNPRFGSVSNLKTVGVATFGEGERGGGVQRLFRVEPGHSAEFVFEQVSTLMACAQTLTLQAGLEEDATSAWAAHYLLGMAKALVDDLAHSLLAAT